MSGSKPRRWPRPIARIAVIVAVLPLGAAILLAAFPWGLVAPSVAGAISRMIGRPVTIAAADRIDHFSFTPTVALRDVAVAQPAWVGRGDIARIGEIRVRFPALPLLLGRFRPRSIVADGVRLDLVRDASGRSNWQPDRRERTGGAGLILDDLEVRRGEIHLVDARRRVALRAALTADRGHGIVLSGTGTHRGQPLTLSVHGGARRGSGAAPLIVSVRSPFAALDGTVQLDRPFDPAAFTADIRASGRNLTYLDDLIEAGLFETQPFRIAGRIRRDPGAWRIERLAGIVGRSRFSADAVVRRAAGRTRLDGRVVATMLDFDDLASDGQRADAAALRRALGPRVIPPTRIRFDRLSRLDGMLRLDAPRLISSHPTAFRSLHATAMLDHRLLTVTRLTVGLRSGSLAGGAVVDHRGATPVLRLDVTLRGARIETLLLPGDAIEGPLVGRIRLSGRGDTVSEALAHSSGKVGLAMPGGTMRQDYATFAGGDVIKSVGLLIAGDRDHRVAVRCLVADLRVAGGHLSPAPLVLDTTIARADGQGAITLPDEQIALALSGQSKRPGLLQYTAPTRLTGTLSDPKLDIRPPRAERKGKGGLLDRVGFFLKGLRTRGDAGRAVPAPAADCPRLIAAALR